MSIVVHSLKDISRKQGMQKGSRKQNIPVLWVFCCASILISKMPVVLYAGK